MIDKLFGTDGIRGVAGLYPLDKSGCIQIGKAIGVYFAKPGDKILIGCDPRQSSDEIVQNVTSGLVAVGVDVISVGVLPTPALAYLTKNSDAVAGVMITASHNPYTDNGIKVFTSSGGKLLDETEEKLNDLINGEIKNKDAGNPSVDISLVTKYEDYLVETMAGARLEGLNIALDSANGATSGVAKRVFERLKANVTTLFDDPDGININDHCGATDTNALQNAVIVHKLDCGAAFDGDGDRLIIVDNKGRQMDGDYIMYILSSTEKHTGVVATIMSNMGLEIALKKQNISLQRTIVGDRYVLEGLENTGYTLGGEQSGHIILPELSTTGDGLLAAIQTLRYVLKSGKKLSEWRDNLELLPQSLVNIPLQNKSLLEREDIKKYIADQTLELENAGRVLVRPSGTEPKARVMVESPDAEVRAKNIAETLTKLLGEK